MDANNPKGWIVAAVDTVAGVEIEVRVAQCHDDYESQRIARAATLAAVTAASVRMREMRGCVSGDLNGWSINTSSPTEQRETLWRRILHQINWGRPSA